MKKLIILLAFICLAARAQMTSGQYIYHEPEHMSYQGDWTGSDIVPVRNGQPTVPHVRDPFRLVGGVVWKLVGNELTNGWVKFEGKIIQVQKTGVLIHGFFTGYPSEGDGADFFVENFPYEMAEGENVGFDDKTKTFLYAKIAGLQTYTTVMGASRTIRKLDYGAIYVPPTPPPLTAEEAAARKVAQEKRKKDGAASTIKWLEDQANAGDAYSQARLGERYLKGDGVDKDESKAREFLQKASLQGNKDASELLQKMAAK